MGETAPPSLLSVLVIAFAILETAGLLAAWRLRRGSAASGRWIMLAVWLCGAAAVSALGYRQYGLSSVLPAVLAVGLSTGIVYLATQRWARLLGGPAVIAVVSAAAVVSTVVLPVCLLFVLMMLGIDGI